MVLNKLPIKSFSIQFLVFISLSLLVSSCISITNVRKYQKNKPFVYKNNIVLNVENVSSDDKVVINSRLGTQLDDSSKVKVKDAVFIFHTIDRPPVFDTIAARRSADNMQSSMVNLGYYSSTVNFTYKIDSSKSDQYRVTTTYTVDAGRRTTIDTFAYLLKVPELQKLAVESKKESPLQEGDPVTKAGILAESNRLVELYRNNGYFKISTEELRVTGDTTIEALTTVSDDPFETLRLLAEANAKRNKPTIKLAILLNNASDSTRFNKYYLNNIYVLPDYIPGDSYTDSSMNTDSSRGYIIKYHKKLFRNGLLTRAMHVKKGDLYVQENYLQTLNSLYKLGVWESPAIDIVELKDTNLLDLVVKLIPIKKFVFEGGLELSYSANSNSNKISTTNSGNLLGFSGNISILNRNLRKEAVRMTNSIRAGVEFNTTKRNSNGSVLNSLEYGYSNSILIPKFITPFKKINEQKLINQQSFINTNVSQINRIDYFNQQIFNLGFGYSWTKKVNRNWIYRPFNIDFRRLYNRTLRFDTTLIKYPFLRYSFNTALVMGSGLSLSSTHTNPKNPNRQWALKMNVEESGLIWGRFKKIISSPSQTNFLDKYLKEFIKADVEYTYTISHPKSAIAFRGFAGVGIPLSKTDTTLPFFKQYFGGGPNSMRGWPVRGIGVGGQPLAPYGSTFFNDRTGDIQLEGNVEYRFNIAPVFGNAVYLKGAFFADAGNIWNYKYTKTNGTADTTQFKFKNLYKQLGVDAGTGLRLDFSYFLIRFDLGFRFKRPDIATNNGWQFPDINFKNLFSTKPANKSWRYENYNFTIGIDYPF